MRDMERLLRCGCSRRTRRRSASYIAQVMVPAVLSSPLNMSKEAGAGRGRGLVCLTSWPIASVNFRSCFVLSSSFLPIWQAFLESKRSRQPHHRICIGRVLLRKSVGFCGGGQLFFPDHFIVVVVPLLSHITRSFFLLPFPSPFSLPLSLSSLGLPRVPRAMFRIAR